jgi:hypothetical protein
MWAHFGQEWKDAHCKLAAAQPGAPGDNVTWTTMWLSNATDAGCTGMQQTIDAALSNGSRFYFYNVFAELDAEGEYFVDRKTRMLYWKPPSSGNVDLPHNGEPTATTTATPLRGFASMLSRVVSMVNVSQVTLRGLALLHARANGVDVLNSAGVSIDSCIISNHGNLAVNLTNCSNSSVRSCNISQTGDGGVWLQGGSRTRLEKSNLVVADSLLTTTNRWDRTYRPGVTMIGCGASVIGNVFTDFPHQCVMVVGNEHTIENNSFTNTVFESSDAGVVYAEQDWTFRGNVIRGNWFEGVHSLYYRRLLWAKKVHPRTGEGDGCSTYR